MNTATRKKYYFDYAATTPLDPRVLREMLPHFSKTFGNPSNLYHLGHQSQKAINDARKTIADILGCRVDEFIFTGSATEADNLAILGVARANPSTKHGTSKIITSAVEHKGILAACDALATEGFEIVRIGVDKTGRIDPKAIKEALDEHTVLVSITAADSETGTLQPIHEIADIISKFRTTHNIRYPYFHTDATQAIVHRDIRTDKLGVDLMTLSAHKLYGPKGIGGLYVRKGIPMKAIMYGGGQQNSLRSGTENIPSIVGFAAALALHEREKKKESGRIKALRDRLEQGIFASIPKVVLNGHPKHRLSNFLNVSILDIEGEAALLYLDNVGISIGTGSACNSQTLEPSYVIEALGHPYEYIHGSLRFTLGKHTTRESVDYVLRVLPPIVKRLRKISPIDLTLDDRKEMSIPQAFVGNQTPHFIRKKQNAKIPGRTGKNQNYNSK